MLSSLQPKTKRYTGRHLVVMRNDGVSSGTNLLRQAAGLRVASSLDFASGFDRTATLDGADALVLPTIGIAIVETVPEQRQKIAAAMSVDSALLSIEPERVVYAASERDNLRAAGTTAEYLEGYRDAVNHLTQRLGASGRNAQVSSSSTPDESQTTWGLQVTRVAASRYSGNGIRLAILDTGIDLGHPDFAGRNITTQSFVAGQPVQDGHGHGTHCVGTACGPALPNRLPRYGIAYNAEIFVGKVLGDNGSGADGDILAGIEWAINNGCQVISMSLTALPDQTPSAAYEQSAKRALSNGTLIVAAAGNESRRPDSIQPVDHPANCPSIMAVGALDADLQVAFFSNAGLNPNGGQVDLAGPGVNVRSAWPRPTLYNTISGTSMATPHAAGIAALLAESQSSVRGTGLWTLLAQTASRLVAPSRDVGSGLVQAP
ncbi:MAG: S8 family peptidase [Candidatus Binataceae bacterium]